MGKESLIQFVRAAALACCLFALAACQPSRNAAPAAPPAAPRTTIHALVWAPDWPQEMTRVVAEFNRDNPDVGVDLQFMRGNSVEENIKPRVAAHALPDLMSVNPNAYAAGLADQGMLADVGHSKAWGQMLDRLKPDWTSREGKRFGISGGVAATLIYYNKGMFAKAGIARAPQSFEEFLDVCERLKRAGLVPIAWSGGFPNMLGNGAFSSGFANNVAAVTPDWRARIANGTLALATPAGADIFAKIRQLAERGYTQPNYLNTGDDEGIRLFTEGRAAMAFHGTWASGVLMHGQGFETGVFVPPWNAAGQRVVPVLGSETGFAVGATPNRAAATRLLEYIAGKGFPIQQNKRHNISPFKVAPGTMVSDPQIVAYVDGISKAPVTGSLYYSMLPSNTIEMLHPLIRDVLAGKVSPRQAAQRVDASIRSEARHEYH